MPVRVEYTKDGTGVVLYHEGVVTGEELYAAISQVYQDNRYPELKYWIGDRTDCTQFLAGYDWQQQIVGLNRKESSRNPGMLLALVSPKDLAFGMSRMFLGLNRKESSRNPGMLLALVSPKDLAFGMSRMFQAISEGDLFKTEVFRDRDGAEKWIKEELVSKAKC